MMLFEVGDEVRVRQPTNLFHSELGKVVSIDHVKLTYKVVFHRGNSDVYTCFDLILVKRQEEKVMKFKVGDKVKILNTEFGNKDKIGTITNISGIVLIYFVEIEGDCGHVCQWSNASDLELVEEEKVMKFKVGDKVKVSNSWEGRSGEVGEIIRISVHGDYNHRVKFEDADQESFKEEELELVQQKGFTKSDLKTGMGVVLRNGDMGHLLLDTPFGDTLRFLNNGSWENFGRYGDDLTHESSDFHDIFEVYSTELSYMYLTDRVFEQECVFKREGPKPEPTKMTMKEINEHFGKPIEIIE